MNVQSSVRFYHLSQVQQVTEVLVINVVELPAYVTQVGAYRNDACRMGLCAS